MLPTGVTPTSSSLPPVPAALADAAGAPRYGSYQGSLAAVDLASLGGALCLGPARRLARHKRWVYTLVATPEVIAMCAIVDLGYVGSAFISVCDLERRELVIDRSLLAPPGPMVRVGDRPAEGLDARVRLPGASIATAWPPGTEGYSHRVSLGRPGSADGVEWTAALGPAHAAPAITVIAPVPGAGRVNVTQKHAALPVRGELVAGGRRWSLDGGVGGLDYTQGYLARRTAWRWAFLCGRLTDGRLVTVNLVEGFNEERTDSNENAVWLGDALHPVGRARFAFAPDDPMAPWHITTTDGAIDLHFTPVAVHREHKNLGLVKSRFVQPLGLFDGTLRVAGVEHAIRAQPGVTEDQDCLW